MNNPDHLDREGNTILPGMVIAVAITMNQKHHFNNYTTRIARIKDDKLIIDGPSAWGYVYDFDPEELQILHGDVNLTNLDYEFFQRFSDTQDYSVKHISTQDAHDFYNAVIKRLCEVSKDYLEIRDHREAKNILLKILSLSGDSDEVIKGKVEKQHLELAVMQEKTNAFLNEMQRFKK